MWSYGFFNSANGDRTYNADQMSGLFEGLITNGVYESVGNKLAVQPNSGMVIQIATGRGFFDKRWVNNDAPYTLTLEASDVLLNRYAAVCIRVNSNDQVRTAEPVIKYSEFASEPVKPTMARTDKINEYCLAYVYIRAGVTAITASDIEDTRNNIALCGWVTGLIDQITPDTLYTQFTEQFNEWFEHLQVELDEETATRLTNALPTSLTVTLTVAGWVDGEQTVSVINMNTTKSVLIQPTLASLNDYAAAGISCTGQGTNSLTFSCETTPTSAITVDVLHMGI